jgi:hypothetical protein
MDVRRRDLVREQDEQFDGWVDDLMQERDALEDTVRDLKGQLAQAAGKEQLLNELQSKMAKVPIMGEQGTVGEAEGGGCDKGYECAAEARPCSRRPKCLPMARMLVLALLLFVYLL